MTTAHRSDDLIDDHVDERVDDHRDGLGTSATDPTCDRVVVLGHGMVGHRFVAELARRAGQVALTGLRVTVLGAEPYEPYNRLMLSEALAGRAELAGLTLPAAPAGVRVFTGRIGTRIDRVTRVVVDDTGLEHPYDTLVCATGAAPRVPALQGLEGVGDGGGGLGVGGDLPAGVRALRTVDDCRALLALPTHRGGRPQRVVVLGGGLLGLEAARALAGRGLRVAVVHSGGHVLDRQLDAQSGAVLGAGLRDLGIIVVTGARAAALRRDRRGALVGLDLADGRHLRCDALLLTAGVAPRVELAAAAGLPVDRGILVGAQLRSPADPRIAAIGDCAQTSDGCPGLLAPGWEQAGALAAQIVARLARVPSGRPADPAAAGGPDAPVAADPAAGRAAGRAARPAAQSPVGRALRAAPDEPREVVRLKAADLDVVTFGRVPAASPPTPVAAASSEHPEPADGCCADAVADLAVWDGPGVLPSHACGCAAGRPAEETRVLTLHDPVGRRSLRVAVRDGRLVGGVLVGAGSLAADLVVAYERDTPLPLDPAQLLVPGGAALPTRTSPADIPGSATICRCNGVTKSAIVAAFEEGTRTLAQLSEATRAATGCGSCTNACAGILEWLEQADPVQPDEAGTAVAPGHRAGSATRAAGSATRVGAR